MWAIVMIAVWLFGDLASRTLTWRHTRFKVKDRQGNIVVGYLLAIPESELADAPQLSDFDPQQSEYVSRLMFNRVAWTQKDLKMTYIAFVPADPQSLEAIQQALPSSTT